MESAAATEPIGHWPVVVLNTDDVAKLAAFYQALTGFDSTSDGPDWVQIGRPPGPMISIQLVENFQPPTWPGGGHPSISHLDFAVADLDTAEAAVVAVGATKHQHQPGTDFRVFIDPSGHLFCLVHTTALGNDK